MSLYAISPSLCDHEAEARAEQDARDEYIAKCEAEDRASYIRSFLLQASLEGGTSQPAKFAPRTRNGEFQSYEEVAREALDELQSTDYDGLTSRVLALALCHYARTTGDKDARKLMQSLAEVSAGLNS